VTFQAAFRARVEPGAAAVLGGGQVVERLVGPLVAVEVNPGVDLLDRFGSGFVLLGPDLLVLERFEEALP